MKYQVITSEYGEARVVFESSNLQEAAVAKEALEQRFMDEPVEVAIISEPIPIFANLAQLLGENGGYWHDSVNKNGFRLDVTYPYSINDVLHYVTILSDALCESYTIQDSTTNLVLASNLSKDDVAGAITKGFELGYRNGFTLLGGLLDD